MLQGTGVSPFSIIISRTAEPISVSFLWHSAVKVNKIGTIVKTISPETADYFDVCGGQIFSRKQKTAYEIA